MHSLKLSRNSTTGEILDDPMPVYNNLNNIYLNKYIEALIYLNILRYNI